MVNFFSESLIGEQFAKLKILELKGCFERLPAIKRKTILLLLELFRTISANSSETKMGPDNIGIVWGPNILRVNQESLDSIVDIPVTCAVVTDLINNSEHFRVTGCY